MSTDKKRYHVYRLTDDGRRGAQMTPKPSTLRECQILVQRQAFTSPNKFEIVEVARRTS